MILGLEYQHQADAGGKVRLMNGEIMAKVEANFLSSMPNVKVDGALVGIQASDDDNRDIREWLFLSYAMTHMKLWSYDPSIDDARQVFWPEGNVDDVRKAMDAVDKLLGDGWRNNTTSDVGMIIQSYDRGQYVVTVDLFGKADGEFLDGEETVLAPGPVLNWVLEQRAVLHELRLNALLELGKQELGSMARASLGVEMPVGEKARRYFNQVLEERPTDQRAVRGMMESFFNEGNLEGVEIVYGQLVDNLKKDRGEIETQTSGYYTAIKMALSNFG